jgi:hypothetical protein
MCMQAMEAGIAKVLAEDNGRMDLDNIERFGALNEGWQVGVWNANFTTPKIPANQSAPCCGFQCQTCAEDPASKFWCKGSIGEWVRCLLLFPVSSF